VSRDIMEKARLGEVLDDIFVFDCHGHLGPSFVHHIPGHDASSMIQTMDHLGVDLLCLSGMASIGGDHRVGNDLVGEAIEMFPHRTLGYACINPHYGEEASEELHRCFDVLKCKAVKIHPMFHAHPANGPGYKPVWEFAARQGCPLLTHTLGGDPTCSPKMFDTLAREYPQVPILLGHAGNNLAGVAEAVEVCRHRKNVFLDLNYATIHYGVVEYLVDRVGVEKLLFGSDVSWNSLSYSLGMILFAKVSDGDKERILGLNAASLFGMTCEKRIQGMRP
jgi:predicted TIM-barrel fold metal-dependent hydrolase